MIVTLTSAQVQLAREVAATVQNRYATEVATRFVPAGQKGKRVAPIAIFVNSNCAELAVAQVTGETWNRGDDLANVLSRKADVGMINEVRWTGARSPELRLYDPSDPTSQDRGHLDRRFWLVFGFQPRMTVHGWMTGRDIVRRGAKKRNPEGKWSYFVPVIEVPALAGSHTCGWARVDDVWTCVQDYYAQGTTPETGCRRVFQAVS